VPIVRAHCEVDVLEWALYVRLATGQDEVTPRSFVAMPVSLLLFRRVLSRSLRGASEPPALFRIAF
jgi:hypothetical protein